MSQESVPAQSDEVTIFRSEAIPDVFKNATDAYRRKKFSFYVLWVFATVVLSAGLFVVCNGIKIVNKEISQSHRLVSDHYTVNSVLPKEKGELSKGEAETKAKLNDPTLNANDGTKTHTQKNKSDNTDKSVVELAVSVYNSALLYLAVTFSALCLCFITLAKAAAAMYSQPDKKDQSNENEVETSAALPVIPAFQEALKIISELLGKKGP